MCRHTHVQAYTCASIHIKKETKEEIKNTVRGWGVTQYVRGPGFVFNKEERKERGREKGEGKMQKRGREGGRHSATSGKSRGLQGCMHEWEAQGRPKEKEHSCGAVFHKGHAGDNSQVQ